MHRDPGAAARALLIAAAIIGATAALASCGGEAAKPARAMTIDFSHKELLQSASTLAIYFYEGTMSCASIRGTLPRPQSLLGPYSTQLDETGRAQGITFTLDDVPAGVYVVFVDALDASGTLVGTGCAPEQTVYDRQISRIRVTVS